MIREEVGKIRPRLVLEPLGEVFQVGRAEIRKFPRHRSQKTATRARPLLPRVSWPATNVFFRKPTEDSTLIYR